MTIITEHRLGHWSASFEDHPEVAFGGDTAEGAATRLLSFRGIDPGPISAWASTSNRITLRIASEPCPDCGGTGKYVGLTTVEDCGACRGKGKGVP